MSDTDIINAALAEPERPPNHIGLEQIIAEVPYMTRDTPALYALYLHYNPHLEQAEKDAVEKLITRMRNQRKAINEKNIQYMERDKVLEKSAEQI